MGADEKLAWPYIGVAFIEGLFSTHKVFIWDRVPGCYTEMAFIQGWPLRGARSTVQSVIEL